MSILAAAYPPNPMSLTEPQYLYLLENLIEKILADGEISIGIARKKNRLFAVIALDEYEKGDLNLYLYCSAKQDFSVEVASYDEDGLRQENAFPLSAENTLIIPEGLRHLMQEAAAKEKDMVFKTGQIR